MLFRSDIYIYFDIDPVIGLARKSGQGPEETNHFEDRKIDFHNRLREGFKEFLTHVPHATIDASQPIDKVWEEFKKLLEKSLGK